MPIHAPFWVFGGTFVPNDVTHRPYPKKDHPWAEPRHLSHKPRIFSYRFLNGHYKSPLHVFPLFNIMGPPEMGFWGYKYGGVNISNVSSL